MSFLARFGLGLCGLSLVAAPAVRAQAPASPYPSNPPTAAQPAGHHHKGLFGYRHCVECQRAYVKAHDGVNVPPPPSALPPGAIPGAVVYQQGAAAPGAVVYQNGAAAPVAAVHQHVAVANGGCAACQAGEVIVGPVTYIDQGAPGHAVVGGQVLMADAPGHAVVGGAMPGMPGFDPRRSAWLVRPRGRWRGLAWPEAGSG